VRVLLSYQEEERFSRHIFPELGVAVVGGPLEVLSGSSPNQLQPVVTLYSERPLFIRKHQGVVVAYFEGLRLELKPFVRLRPADPARPVGFRLLLPGPSRPAYPGELWLEARAEGFLLVNRVGLEDYLKRVLPSEMPPVFPPEALKAQAVAARTYAYSRQKSEGFWRRFGADLSDSVSEQAYNLTPPRPASDRAVEETRGQVLTFSGAPIQAFYFSTSPGFTAGIEEVWPERPSLPYLRPRPQGILSAGPLKREEEAQVFFKNWNPAGFFDAESPFWRWRVRFSRPELERLLSQTLPERARTAPEYVETLEGALPPEAPGFSLGRLREVAVLKRGRGGYVSALQITTSTGRYVVRRESHIRALLRPSKALSGGEDVLLELWQGPPRPNFPLLPSAAFAIAEERDPQGNLLYLTLWGGGLGHGVGMSQYGALGLARQGYGYRQILAHFYPGSRLETPR
jgi:stage II sporulation protein D